MKATITLIIIQLFFISQITFGQNSIDSLNLKPKREILNQIIKDTIDDSHTKVIKNKSIFFNKKRDYIKIGISGVATVAGTITSYLFKSEAIENNDLYQQTNIQDYYDKSKKYDIYFAVSMAVTQIAFSSLIYFLFFE